MQQRCRQSGIYSCSRFALVVGMILLADACSADVIAPKNSNNLAISASHGTPITVGSVTFTGSSAIVDTILQVSVTVKNDSTAPVSFGYGPCGLHIELYQNAAHSGSPIWARQGPSCLAIAEPTVMVGQSLTVMGAVPLTELTQGTNGVAAGTFYVTASTIYNAGNTNFPTVVDAGTVTVP
jgi:hypothetical protein